MPPTDELALTLPEAVHAVERGEIDHLTCDVFDTVVWRDVATPTDLFLDVAAELARASGREIDPDGLRAARVDAEHRARVRATVDHGVPECTLEEIWSQMPSAFLAEAGVRAELAVEARRLRPLPGVAQLMSAARARGVPITLVSDIYLSATQLRTVLTAAGVDLDGVDVITSADRRKNKWGGLLDDVVAATSGDVGRVLHVGDHPVSDVAAARRSGVRVCHVDLAEGDDTVTSAAAPWKRWSDASGTDAARSAVVRETLVGAGALGRDPSFQFGAAVAGPVMVGFAGWVGWTARELGASSVHCLLREGARIAELIDVVDPDAPERVLVHASRWAIMRAAVVDGTAEEIELAIARRADLRAEHLVEAFGCDLQDARRVLGGSAVPRDRRSMAYHAIADDERLRSAIVERSAELRIGALRYLERRLHLDDGPLVLCDIGWGGTIQQGIEAILRSGGHDPAIVGLYALLSPPGRVRRGRGADLRSYLPWSGPDGWAAVHAKAVVRHPEHLERINTPQLGTLLEFRPDGEPVTRPDDHDPIGTSLRDAQLGVDRFARTWSTMVGSDRDLRHRWVHDAGLAAAALAAYAATVTAPDPRLADALGAWTHDDVAGTGQESLGGSDFRRWARYANAVDAAAMTMHDVFWAPGAGGSALAHQSASLAAGANPDVVCPPVETGLARIAVFPPGTGLAVAQHESVPRQTVGGWSLLQLGSAVPGLRSVRIDLGAVPLRAEIADARIVLGTADGEHALVDDPAGLRRAGTWIDGRWGRDGRAVAASGGHLLVDVPVGIGAVEHVTVSIAFRTSPLSDAEQRRTLPTPVLRADALRRAIRGRLARVARRMGR